MNRPHEQMSDALLARVAEQFKALADPSRLRLMSLLLERATAVGELAARAALPVANVSKHLQVLHQAGFVRRRKEGPAVLYSAADAGVRRLCDLMCKRVRQRAAAEMAVTRSRRPGRRGAGSRR